VVAGTLAAIALATGASGSDVAAAAYRVALFRQVGLTLWDSGWYAGHWTFDYSLLFPPVGAALGIAATDVLCAVVSAWAFDRLAVPHFGRAGRVGAIVFAAGTLVQVADGRVPFLLGQTLALVALLGVQRHAGGWRRWWPLAGVFAFAASLASPLAGAFLALAAFAWLLADLPALNLRAGTLAIAAVLPIAAMELAFKGLGAMPFASLDFVGMMVASTALLALTPVTARALRIGIALYMVSVVGSYLVPSAVGVNITRLGTSFGLGLLVCMPALWRNWRSRLILAVALVPFALGEWVPAAPALGGASNPGVNAAYFRPLLGYLEPHDHPLARVEVVPTAGHWEADYVAIDLPVARGWERQVDTVENPIFYVAGALNAKSYRAWLMRNGVRFVALADAPLDYAGVAEARLVRAGVPGLKLVWRSAHWRVYELAGASGIVSGPGRLVSERGSSIVLDLTRPGRLLVRVHYEPAWQVRSGRASLRESGGGWLVVSARRSGRVALQLSL
jgi:hypothetical protein